MLPGKNSTLGKLTFANSTFSVDGNGEGRGGANHSNRKQEWKHTCTKSAKTYVVNHTIWNLQWSTAKRDGGQQLFTFHSKTSQNCWKDSLKPLFPKLTQGPQSLHEPLYEIGTLVSQKRPKTVIFKIQFINQNLPTVLHRTSAYKWR